jgi:hypothetical protein
VRRILPHIPINPSGLRSPRLVYYRLYTKDGPITSNNPIYANDPFLSRTLTKFITPPHTALSVKNHICSVENLPRTTECSLFESLSGLTAIENTARLSIRGPSGPGFSEHEPVILVTASQDVERPSPKLEPGMLPDAALHEPRYRTSENLGFYGQTMLMAIQFIIAYTKKRRARLLRRRILIQMITRWVELTCSP